MKCYNCNKICNLDFNKQIIKNCDCDCKSCYHYKLENFDETYDNSLKLFYKDLNNVDKNLTEIKNLAKSFGVLWLPFGIQPSEVDRFLKSFPQGTEARNYLFKKSPERCVYLNLQLPNQDRNFAEMVHVNSSTVRQKVEDFISKRRNNMNVGRIDHLDIPEGQICAGCQEIISFGEICVQTPHTTSQDKQNKSTKKTIILKKKSNKNIDLLRLQKCWHPNCFKCLKCKNLLLDYIYCWDDEYVDEDDNIGKGPLCLRHYDDRFHPRCQACDEMIFDEEYIEISIDEYYHKDHFLCSNCNKMLTSSDIEVQNELIACDGSLCVDNENNESKIVDNKKSKKFKCLHCLYGTGHEVCRVCQEPVTESEMNLVNKIRNKFNHSLVPLHRICNNCHSCNSLLTINTENDQNCNQPQFHRYRNGYTVCHNCQYGAQIRFYCRSCLLDVDLDSESVIRTGQFVWHRTCLLCMDCKVELTPDMNIIVLNKMKNSRNLTMVRDNIEDPCDNYNNNDNEEVGNNKKLDNKVLYPVCEKCFRNKLADVCTSCFKKIEEYGVKYGKRMFHKECFRCRKCKNILDKDQFMISTHSNDDEYDDDLSDPYCFSCAGQLFAKKCAKCSLPITDSLNNNQMVMFEGKYWHDRCFNCFKCCTTLLDMGFLFTDDRLSCTVCE